VADELDAGPSAHSARDDIRLAEAARMLGLLTVDGLTERAISWISGGVDTPNVRALARPSEASDGVRLALVAEIAAELGVGFSTTQDARNAHAEQVIRSMHAGENIGGQIYALANGYTDELVSRLRLWLGRVLRRS
jgi:hypothetical protein